MWIRLPDETFAECPDEVAALILADPMSGNILPDFSLAEINALVHWGLGAFADDDLTWTEMLEEVKAAYLDLPGWSATNVEKAQQMILNYNTLVKPEEIGRVDIRTLFSTEKIVDNSFSTPLLQK